MLLQNKEIAIIGGGPGGLSLARLLQLKGVNVKVYERDKNREARGQGGPLDLHTQSGLAALEKAGLMNEFKTHYRPGAELMRVVDSQAKIYLDEHVEGSTSNFGDEHHRPEIDRGPLRDILLDSLQPNTVVWDSHILSVEKQPYGWQINFENGNTAVADIIIGADGAKSKIRPFVTDIKPFYTGVTILEGTLKDAAKAAPHVYQLLKGGIIFALGNQQTLSMHNSGDGSLGFYTGCKTSELWYKESGIDFKDHEQILAWFKNEFSTWGSIWYELFENDQAVFIPRPQYCMPLNQKWESQLNITLLGDAAHWMPPYAGEGVNMAMLDALQLSEALTSNAFTTTKAAIANYEQQMLERFAKMGEETLYNTQWMHAPDALNKMLEMFSWKNNEI